MAQIKLVIKNWNKYQKRSDYKAPWWFSFHNEFWKAEKYSLMTHEQKWAWICILSHASEQKCNGTIVFNDDWLCRVGNVSKRELYLCIETLIKTDTLEAEFDKRTESVQKLDENRCHTIDNKQYTINNKQLTKIQKTIDADASRPASPALEKGSSNSRLIGEYAKAYKLRYNANPVIDGPTQGAVKRILKSVSEQKAIDLVQAYLQMNEPWFVTKAHDFITFEKNLTKISLALQKGVDLGAPPKKKTFEELLAEQEREENGQRFLQRTD